MALGIGNLLRFDSCRICRSGEIRHSWYIFSSSERALLASFLSSHLCRTLIFCTKRPSTTSCSPWSRNLSDGNRRGNNGSISSPVTAWLYGWLQILGRGSHWAGRKHWSRRSSQRQGTSCATPSTLAGTRTPLTSLDSLWMDTAGWIQYR